MAIEKVRKYLATFGAEDRIQEFDVSSATVELAAEALGCSAERIAKTLAFLVDGSPILIVASGDARIDNPKFKGQFHTRAKMVAPDTAEELVGHAVGGVCPFAVVKGVPVYLDVSLKRFSTVFPACGSSNSVIELSITELEEFSQHKDWVDVCKLV